MQNGITPNIMLDQWHAQTIGHPFPGFSVTFLWAIHIIGVCGCVSDYTPWSHTNVSTKIYLVLLQIRDYPQRINVQSHFFIWQGLSYTLRLKLEENCWHWIFLIDWMAFPIKLIAACQSMQCQMLKLNYRVCIGYFFTRLKYIFN